MDVKQLQLNFEKAKELRDLGMLSAEINANKKNNEWSCLAFNFLIEYAKNNTEFLAEDVRAASADIVPEPPSKRAWGGIFVRACKTGLICRNGYRKVSNPKAHCTPATLWKVVI